MSKIEVHHFTGETLIEKQNTDEMDTLKFCIGSQAMGREMNSLN